MTREEAIERFQRMKKILSIPNSDAARTIEAIDMAIHALEQEPTAEYSSDVISRQAAIEAVEKAVFKDVAKSAIESLPSTDRLKGYWIKKENPNLGVCLKEVCVCSNCNVAVGCQYFVRRSFCPNCGADMRSKEQ